MILPPFSIISLADAQALSSETNQRQNINLIDYSLHDFGRVLFQPGCSHFLEVDVFYRHLKFQVI